MNQSVQNAIEAIRLADTTDPDDLNAIITEVKDLQSRSARKAQRQFSVGDHVTFESRKGAPVTGVVTKLLQKNVQVTTEGGQSWRVTPNLLTHK